LRTFTTRAHAVGAAGTASLHAAGLAFWLAAGLLAAAAVTAALMPTRDTRPEPAEPMSA
jgi:hypothetical protein